MTVEVPAINEDKLNAFRGQVVGELGATVNAAPAAAFPGANYDLVTMFDCLHDMGDPVGAAGHVRQALAPDGTWMVVEPIAGDRVEQNLNPVGRAYYAFSTMLCTPSSLAQEVGLALGHRPARLASATWPPRPGSPASAESRRRRSTRSTRSDRSASPGRRRSAGPVANVPDPTMRVAVETS